jgi:hypothetical protein
MIRNRVFNDCSTRQALEHILDPAWPMSLHVALRTEAALAAEDVLNAASLTRTFLDVAEYDVINRTLSRDQRNRFAARTMCRPP